MKEGEKMDKGERGAPAPHGARAAAIVSLTNVTGRPMHCICETVCIISTQQCYSMS